MAADALALPLTLAMLAVAALTLGGLHMAIRRGDRRKGMLMLVAALVLLGNVLVLAWPA